MGGRKLWERKLGEKKIRERKLEVEKSVEKNVTRLVPGGSHRPARHISPPGHLSATKLPPWKARNTTIIIIPVVAGGTRT